MVTIETVKNRIWELRENYHTEVQDLIKRVSDHFTEDEIVELQEYV